MATVTKGVLKLHTKWTARRLAADAMFAAMVTVLAAAAIKTGNLKITIEAMPVFLGALLTGLGVYDDLARFAGAGSLVPITGFANAVVSPALEFKTEGLVTGTAVKVFTIAGPVIVYGIGASVIYGLILAVFGLA